MSNTIDRERELDDESSYYHSKSFSHSYARMHTIDFGASYDINPKNILALSLSTETGAASAHFQNILI